LHKYENVQNGNALTANNQGVETVWIFYHVSLKRFF